MSAAASAADNKLNILPHVYEVLKSIDNDSPDVSEKMQNLESQFQKAQACIDRLPGTQYSQEEQLRLKAVLQQQLILKTEMLMKFKTGNQFEEMSDNGDIPPVIKAEVNL